MRFPLLLYQFHCSSGMLPSCKIVGEGEKEREKGAFKYLELISFIPQIIPLPQGPSTP